MQSILVNIFLSCRKLAMLVQEPFDRRSESTEGEVSIHIGDQPLRRSDLDENLLKETLLKVKANMRNHKSGVDENLKHMDIQRTKLHKAQKDVVVQKRVIELCTREIDHHCCICGGIHVFSDHDIAKRDSCKRLKSKIRSLMYLKQGLKEAEVRVKLCQSALDESTTNTSDAQSNMALSLSQGLSLLESLSNTDDKRLLPTCEIIRSPR